MAFFVAALLVIAVILFSGGDDNDDEQQGVTVGEATRTSVQETAAVQPSVTTTATTTTTMTAPGTATSTTGGAAPTATTADIEPTETTAPEDGEPVPTQEEEASVDEPEPTEEPAVEEPAPTEEPVVEEPVPSEDPPAIGDFGTLPPAQIVSGGLSRTLNLDYEIATSLSNLPSSAPVYLLEWPAWTEDDVATIAANLDLDGAIEGGPGNYQVFGSTSEIYFSGPTVQYVYTGSLPELPLGDDASAIESARSWIYANGFISDDLDGGVVIGRDDDAGRAVVLFKPAQVSPVLSFVPSATVTVGPGGSVIESNIRWPANYIGSEYGLWSGDALWNKVLAGEASIEADLSAVGGNGALSGTLTVYDISIAYSYAGTPGSDEFLVPLIVFSGEATLNETGDVVPVSVYVSAIAGQATPQG
ncbi:MAG: hypothetical protein M3439_06270 [Chloroflexota bacterium]|nr:hypothetical protein [Chloroflexota bacterium]